MKLVLAPALAAEDSLWLGILWRAAAEAADAAKACPLPAGACACPAVAMTAATAYVDGARVALSKAGAV